MTLTNNGLRFVCRGYRDFRWAHPLEMLHSDIDCTDMSDSEFEALVASHHQGGKQRCDEVAEMLCCTNTSDLQKTRTLNRRDQELSFCLWV